MNEWCHARHSGVQDLVWTVLMSDCDTIEGSISSTTPYPTHTHIKNLSTAATNSSTPIKTVANLPYYNMTSTAITMTELSSGIIIATPTMSDHNTTEGSISSTTPYPTHTRIKNLSIAATNSSTPIKTVANLPYYNMTSTAITMTELSSGIIIATPTMSDHNTTEGSISSTTPYPTHTRIKNLSIAATNSSTPIKTVANLPYCNMTSTAIATTELSNGTIIATPTMSDHDTTEGSISSTTLFNG